MFFGPLLWDLIMRQARGRYAGSFFGVWWAVITPVFLAASIHIVFTRALRVPESGFDARMVWTGLVPWFYFSQTLLESTTVFAVEANFMKQALVPRYLLPLANALANGLYFLVGVLLMLFFFVATRGTVSPVLFALVPATLLLAVLVSGGALLFAAGRVLWRDLSTVAPFLLMVWFWLTPVFYSLDNADPAVRGWVLYNPMASFIPLFQSAVVEGVWPSGTLFVRAAAWSFGSLLAGWIVFRRADRDILKKI